VIPFAASVLVGACVFETSDNLSAIPGQVSHQFHTSPTSGGISTPGRTIQMAQAERCGGAPPKLKGGKGSEDESPRTYGRPGTELFGEIYANFYHSFCLYDVPRVSSLSRGMVEQNARMESDHIVNASGYTLHPRSAQLRGRKTGKGFGVCWQSLDFLGLVG